MNINFRVNIKGGPRTPIEVLAFPTGSNTKTLKFKNGCKLTDGEISEWLETELLKALKKIEATK